MRWRFFLVRFLNDLELSFIVRVDGDADALTRLEKRYGKQWFHEIALNEFAIYHARYILTEDDKEVVSPLYLGY